MGDTRWRAALALRLLDEAGVPGIPVAAGLPGSELRPVTRSGDVLLPLAEDDSHRDAQSAHDLMAEVIADAPQPVWLATTGPATR